MNQNKITEIIPDDLPEWALKAMADGQLFNRLTELVVEARAEGIALAVGWAYADCCSDLDKGKDPRKNIMPDVLDRARHDLG